ncbi:MAG: hypothetical protein IJ337_01725, partial [Clostridia bacterium]|nr:hypothetical protein [Clostridia bacterium]
MSFFISQFLSLSEKQRGYICSAVFEGHPPKENVLVARRSEVGVGTAHPEENVLVARRSEVGVGTAHPEENVLVA